jgi:hypothetical protein
MPTIPIDQGPSQPSTRRERVVRALSDEDKPESLIELRSAALGRGIEHQERARLRNSQVLGGPHQGGGDASAAVAQARHRLGDRRAVRLVDRVRRERRRRRAAG